MKMQLSRNVSGVTTVFMWDEINAKVGKDGGGLSGPKAAVHTSRTAARVLGSTGEIGEGVLHDGSRARQ